MSEAVIVVNSRDWWALNYALLQLTDMKNKETAVNVCPDETDKAISRLTLLKHKIYDELEKEEEKGENNA